MAVSWVRSGRSVRLSDVSFQSVQVNKNDDDVLAEYHLRSFDIYSSWFCCEGNLNETCISRVSFLPVCRYNLLPSK